jgi:DNA-binding response OmpR family regulator
MAIKKSSILVVDDDVNIARLIQRVLEMEGHEAVIACDGELAFEIFQKSSFSLALLDIVMPGLDGITLCKKIRRISDIPIIMITARDSITDKLEGFNAGTDDYIVKPFPIRELVARVNAVLRRSVFPECKTPVPPFSLKGLKVDYSRQVATINGKILDLTPTEYRILVFLTNNPFKVLSFETILKEVWGEEYLSDIHLLQVNIGRLRSKIKAIDKNARYIETKTNLGYMLNPDEESK